MKDIFKIHYHLFPRLLQQANPVVHLMCDLKVPFNYEGKAVRICIRVLLLEKRQVTAYIFAFKS